MPFKREGGGYFLSLLFNKKANGSSLYSNPREDEMIHSVSTYKK